MEKYYSEFAEACARAMPDKDCNKYFKRYDTKELPRIIKVIGFLKNIQPKTLLDVGSGRGRALWPIAYALPQTQITCIDMIKWRCEVINAVNKGGVSRVCAINGDISSGINFDNNSFELISALEVMEHIPNVESAVTEIIRLARKFIIITVPSKPDNNPDHIHFFTQQRFEKILNLAEERTQKSLRRVTFDYIPKHMVITIGL